MVQTLANHTARGQIWVLPRVESEDVTLVESSD